MIALQSAVVAQEAEAYALFRRVCPDCQTFRPVKDHTTRHIRTVFGTVEVRNPRWMLCRNCHPGMDAAFAPLKEICPDRATPELMELTARLGSMLPYRQAASMLAEFLPIEPTETHATVRKRTIRIGQRLDDQIARESWCARTQVDERCQLEVQIPGDRRKEFVISIDTAQCRCTLGKKFRNRRCPLRSWWTGRCRWPILHHQGLDTGMDTVVYLENNLRMALNHIETTLRKPTGRKLKAYGQGADCKQRDG